MYCKVKTPLLLETDSVSCVSTTMNFQLTNSSPQQASTQRTNPIAQVAAENTDLYCCSQSNNFIRVNSHIRILASQPLDEFLYGWYSCGTSNKDDLIDILESEFCISQGILHRSPTTAT
jgi:hypothetical protein